MQSKHKRKAGESMKNRLYKFLIMLMIVIAVGSGATMLNLSMQKKAAEADQSFRPYTMVNQLQLAEETQAAVSATGDQTETGSSALSENANVMYDSSPEKSAGSAAESETVPEDSLVLSDDQKADHEPVEEMMQKASDIEKQVYYARLEDMERVYTARMKAVTKEALAVQQKTAEELLEIWDDELNAIYQKLRKTLSEDDFYTLRNEERAWIRNRDAAANRAAAKENYGNSAQNLAYTRSLLQWTKDRVYELAAMYYGE